MKYYILVLSKWYAFVRIFISCQIFFSVVNKKSLRGKECQKAFDTIKKLVFRDTLLSYHNFNEPFEIHKDASKLQQGSVISQKG